VYAGEIRAIFACAICSCEKQITSGRLMRRKPLGGLPDEI